MQTKKIILCVAIVFAILFVYYQGVSYSFGVGEIINNEAQNIVNIADLIIKSEHSYMQNTGNFANLIELEENNPPYLSSLAVVDYFYQGSYIQCVQKILSKEYVYICVNPPSGSLYVFMPQNLSNTTVAEKEISEGITGEPSTTSSNPDMPFIFFDLIKNPPSFESNPDTAAGSKGSGSIVSSINTSPNTNGGVSYASTDNNSGYGSIVSKIVSVITGFFAGLLSIF